jgi:hypothetical protein
MKRFIKNQHVGSSATTRLLKGVTALALGAATALAYAQAPTTQGAAAGVEVYPAKGQSAQQQDKDKYQCFEWARAQTGFDPTQATQAAPATQPHQSRGLGSAMVKGAAGGAAVARIAHGDAGRGAAAGAISGAMREGAQKQQLVQASQQQAAQQQAVRGQQRGAYDRAFGACMEGRGYSVR